MAADPLTTATVDDLLNYGTSDDEDPFGDGRKGGISRDDKATLSPRQAKRKVEDLDGGNDALGLDEEVQIKKKRKPIAKLDEARLLSAPGIPKIRELSRSGKIAKKLKFKGKGHEFSDVARLLNYYQLWLDNLYPRAKFADGLQLVEKVGHTKRLQVMRKEWIDEGKPGYARDRTSKHDESEFQDLYSGDKDGAFSAAKTGGTHDLAAEDEDDSLFIEDSRPRNPAPDTDGLPDDDELEALLAEQETHSEPPKSRAALVDAESEGEDDLDALLAEQETRRPNVPTSSHNTLPSSKARPTPIPVEDDLEDDDLDALLAENEAERINASAAQASNPQSKGIPRVSATSKAKRPTRIFEDSDDEDEDMDDLDALLAEQDARQQPMPLSAPAAAQEKPVEQDDPNIFSSSPLQQDTSHENQDEGDGSVHVEVSKAIENAADAGAERTQEELDAEGMFSSSPLGEDN